MVELNRRTFLSGSVAAGAVALFGTEAAHAAGAVKLPAKWDPKSRLMRPRFN